MDFDEKSPREVILRRMSYTELRKYAKQRGIKANLKADTLISCILETSADEDSFSTVERKVINSCKKNKKEKFDTDKEVLPDTPRRGTYTIDDSPNKGEKSDTAKEVSSISTRQDTFIVAGPLDDVMAMNDDSIFESASPVLKKTPNPSPGDTSLNVTIPRGSEKKKKKPKVSFVTPLRRSTRVSSVMGSAYASTKNRPKTPIPSRVSSLGRNLDREEVTPMPQMLLGSMGIKSWSPAESGKRLSKLSNGKRPSTPMPISNQKKMKLSFERTGRNSSFKGTPAVLDLKEEDEENSEQEITTAALPPVVVCSVNLLKDIVLETTSVVIPAPSPFKIIAATPVKQAQTPQPVSGIKSKKAVPVTPNFNKLHQRAFNKMESIDEYNKRKAMSSAKKLKDSSRFHTPGAASKSKDFAAKKIRKIPKRFGGIPFIPSVTHTKDMRTNFGSMARNTKKVSPQKSKKVSPPKSKKVSLPKSKKVSPPKSKKVSPPKSRKDTTMKNKKATPLKSKQMAIAKSKKITPPKSRTVTPHIKTTIYGSLPRSVIRPQKHIPTGSENKNTSILKENNTKRRTKFDLKASLSRKLPYKPYSGPLKPVNDQTTNTTLHTTAMRTPLQKRENLVVIENRTQSRNVLRGVRKNRRFELQMSNRKMVAQ